MNRMPDKKLDISQNDDIISKHNHKRIERLNKKFEYSANSTKFE